MKIPLLAIAVVIVVLSCGKEGEKFDKQAYRQCHQAMQLDSSGVLQKLSGSWNWIKYAYGGTGTIIKADKEVIITFFANGNYEQKENGLITTGTWKINRVIPGLYEIRSNPFSYYLNGYISFCENEVFLDDGGRDGMEHLFKRR